MKYQTFTMTTPQAKEHAIGLLANIPTDGSIEVIFRDARLSKTRQQLGGLFGCWIKYISEQTGESENYIHRMLKAKFLARIYISDPQGEYQEQWVELLAIYVDNREQEKFVRHAKRISLTWSTIKQMSDYMRAIEQHFIDENMPLPILDRFKSDYEK